MDAVNKDFSVGDVFVGLVDGNTFTVEDVLPPGRYESSTGGFWIETDTTVVFRDKRKGKKVFCTLKLAQHLLLKRLSLSI